MKRLNWRARRTWQSWWREIIPGAMPGWEKCPLPGGGKEAVDRRSITLEQEDLIKQMFASNPRTVVVLRASFPYAIN